MERLRRGRLDVRECTKTCVAGAHQDTREKAGERVESEAAYGTLVWRRAWEPGNEGEPNTSVPNGGKRRVCVRLLRRRVAPGFKTAQLHSQRIAFKHVRPPVFKRHRQHLA